MNLRISPLAVLPLAHFSTDPEVAMIAARITDGVTSELARVPDAHIHFPAAMKPAELASCGLRLGVDYPLPVVDHARARKRTLMRLSLLPDSDIS